MCCNQWPCLPGQTWHRLCQTAQLMVFIVSLNLCFGFIGNKNMQNVPGRTLVLDHSNLKTLVDFSDTHVIFFWFFFSPSVLEEDSWLHAGPPGNLYLEQSFQQLSSVLKLPPQEPAMQVAQRNAQLVGQALDAWVDTSVESFWVIGDLCATQTSSCPALGSCSKTAWSPLSPDPKSDMGPVKSDGRIR